MSDSVTKSENVTASGGHRDAITASASPRPWRIDDGFACEIVDATGRHVLTATSRYAVPPLGDKREAANAALIVAAVNERDLIAARLEAFDKKLEEAVAIYDALCAERDRLRDIVRRLITIHQNIFWRKDEKTGMLYYDCAIDEEKIRKTIEEARAAIGESKE